MRVGAQRAAHGEDVRGLHHLERESPRGDGALHFVPRRAALHRDGQGDRIDGTDPVEPAHVQHDAAPGVGVASLTVAASGDRHLEPALPRVPQDGPELVDLPDGVHPLHARGRQARDVTPDERVLGPEKVLVRDDERAGVKSEGEQDGRGERHGQPPGGQASRSPVGHGRSPRLSVAVSVPTKNPYRPPEPLRSGHAHSLGILPPCHHPSRPGAWRR